MNGAPPDRLIRLPEVLRRVGVSKSTLYRMIREGMCSQALTKIDPPRSLRGSERVSRGVAAFKIAADEDCAQLLKKTFTTIKRRLHGR